MGILRCTSRTMSQYDTSLRTVPANFPAQKELACSCVILPWDFIYTKERPEHSAVSRKRFRLEQFIRRIMTASVNFDNGMPVPSTDLSFSYCRGLHPTLWQTLLLHQKHSSTQCWKRKKARKVLHERLSSRRFRSQQKQQNKFDAAQSGLFLTIYMQGLQQCWPTFVCAAKSVSNNHASAVNSAAPV